VTLKDNSVNAVLASYGLRLAHLHPASEIVAIQRAVFEHQLGWDRAQLEMRRGEKLSESEVLKVFLPLKRLERGEPLQYVLGSVRFHGLEIHVAPGVLIPRPETEELVDLIIRSGEVPRCIVDIGTGSGVVALALKQAFQGARVVGIDSSEEALRVARANGARLGLDVDWILMDILSDQARLPQQVDLVVSNPPYIPWSEAKGMSPHVRDQEPAIALFVEDTDPHRYYRRIAELARSSSTSLWFEGHHRSVVGAAEVVRATGFGNTEVMNDMSGSTRFIHAVR
jgi:release factor glutamine methyltransferase